MKLGALNAAIRDAEKVSVFFNAGGRVPLAVAVQKTSLIEALKDAFPEGRAHETGLALTEGGFLTSEAVARKLELFP